MVSPYPVTQSGGMSATAMAWIPCHFGDAQADRIDAGYRGGKTSCLEREHCSDSDDDRHRHGDAIVARPFHDAK